MYRTSLASRSLCAAAFFLSGLELLLPTYQRGTVISQQAWEVSMLLLDVLITYVNIAR
jgi:hypothetical protein